MNIDLAEDIGSSSPHEKWLHHLRKTPPKMAVQFSNRLTPRRT